MERTLPQQQKSAQTNKQKNSSSRVFMDVEVHARRPTKSHCRLIRVNLDKILRLGAT